MVVKGLNSYSVMLYAKGEGEGAGIINLKCHNYRLELIFNTLDTNPPNTYNPDYKVGRSYLPFDQYQHYLDLVRNEKPIRVKFLTRHTSAPPVFIVSCGEEPPGEGEPPLKRKPKRK